jgi:nicotinate-nucleotide adenylyltransferase
VARRIVAGVPIAAAGQRIGLLGGSFNPAHAGHLHISALARARLGLDGVWWLVSPQNPLKAADETAPLARRLARARDVARTGYITVTDLEARLQARYSIDTVRFLTGRFPGARFVWIMGADNLEIFHRWRGWREIAVRMPIAVIDRPGAGPNASAAPAARRLAAHRWPEEKAHGLADLAPPAWVLVHGPMSPLSSTTIREGAAEAD